MRKLLLLTAGALLLASCNGAIIPNPNPNPGTNPPVGGNPPGGTPPTTTTPYIPTAGAAVGTGDGTKEGTVYVSPSADEIELLNLVNEVRTKGTLNGVDATAESCVAGKFVPLKPLTYNGLYAFAARKHAEYSSNVAYEGHTESQTNSGYFYGTTVRDRVKKTYGNLAGLDKYYEGDNVTTYGGELVAPSTANATQALNGWLYSYSHCIALMNPNTYFIGTAFSIGNLPPESNPMGIGHTRIIIVSPK